MTTTATDDWRELATRKHDGLAVSLLWSKATNSVKVSVAGAALDDEFQIDVARPHALDAFYHPFAYGGAMRESTTCSRF